MNPKWCASYKIGRRYSLYSYESERETMRKWYNNGEEEKLIEETEIIPNGFTLGRKPKKQRIDELVKKFPKDVIYRYYIIENHRFNETYEHFGITRTDIRTLLTKYKITKDFKLRAKNNKYKRTHNDSILIGKKSAATQKKNWLNKPIEEKELWSNRCREFQLNLPPEKKESKKKKYKEYWNNLSLEEKEKINKKRSDSCKESWKSDSLKEKQHKTYRKHKKGRFCRTILEQTIYECLIKVFPDLIYDSKIDERYPYYCDFYIPSLDLFIEINGHPSHGSYPYIENDKRSMEESYKLYGDWLKTYTVRDVEKYNKAVDSKINYLRIYPSTSIEENYKINNFMFIEVINTIFVSITK